MLTNAAAKAATPQARAYKLADAGGLHLHVATTGTKTWRLKYRFGGREKLLTIGRFPEIALADARARREAAKAQLRAGADPSVVDNKMETLEQLARAWCEHNRASWSAAHAADVIASLEKTIFPALGQRSAAAIGPNELLNAIRSVEGRGCVETARRIRQRLSGIFGFGIAQGLLERDPAAQLGRAMQGGRPPRPQPALTQIESCRELLAACDHAGGLASIGLASRFLALTAVRLDAVRGMRWSEVEDLDGDAPAWRVPAARMKLKLAKKGEARFDHVVPLSRQAVAVLRLAATGSGYDTPLNGYDARSPVRGQNGEDLAPLVFPGRDRGRPIGEGAIGALYDRAGFGGRHVPHGWRSSFSTILNEQLGDEWRSAIDRALAHSPKDKVEAAYNRAEQLGRRRDLFDRWGAMLAG